MRLHHLTAAALLTVAPSLAQYCRVPLAAPSALTQAAAFGTDVALGPRDALVGAPGDSALGVDAGAAVFYSLDPSLLTLDVAAVARASDGSAGDGFGGAVALDGQVAVIGAPWYDRLGLLDAGAAYVFRRVAGQWVEEQRLSPSLSGAAQYFGRAVDISGDRIVVGQGNACFVFRRTGGVWSEEAALGTDGRSVSIDGDLLACPSGAYAFDPGVGTWNQELAGMQWQQVSLDADHLAVFPGGLAIAIRRRDPTTGVWTQVGSSSVPSATQVAFELADGCFTRIVGGLLFVLTFDPSVGILGLTPWTSGHTFSGPSAVSDGRLIAKVVGWSQVLLFDLRCAREQFGFSYCQPTVLNSAGLTGHLDVAGSIDLLTNDASLVATGLPPYSTAVFLVSRQMASPGNPGSSQGQLCLGAPFGRFDAPGEIQSTGAHGRCSLQMDLNSLPTSTGTVAVIAGESWNFQTWYRDTNPTATSNLTSGVSVQWQ